MTKKDFLLELLTEELPPKNLLLLAQSLAEQIKTSLEKAQFTFRKIQHFATPRRLAVLITHLDERQPDQILHRQGPALSAAFDSNGYPTQACLGFAKSCNAKPNQLKKQITEKGTWVCFDKIEKGKSVTDLIPSMISEALGKLPIPKLMRWADFETAFVRPVHRVIMLYGNQVIRSTLLNCKTDQKTEGHRFLSPELLTISRPQDYEIILKKHSVVVDFQKRQELIQKQIQQIAKQKKAKAIISSKLLEEVTALVEFPVALCIAFPKKFLLLPKELLIASVQKHQKSFLLENTKKALLPFFITISNIKTSDHSQIVAGNERVMNARLNDAQFFYQSDFKNPLETKRLKLDQLVFHKKLGTMLEKTDRLMKLGSIIASHIKADVAKTERAAFLSKADLVSEMVGEFPELQGIMGYYYAQHDKEDARVAKAIVEHYMPLNATSSLPLAREGQALALADRLDTLIGIFGIKEKPTGDKDPFGLRRAAIGIIRIIIENRITIKLAPLLDYAHNIYEGKLSAENLTQEVSEFIFERLKHWVIEQKLFSIHLFNAVKSVCADDLLDFFNRMEALSEFQKLSKADNLIAAHKRVNNLLSKERIIQAEINFDLCIEQPEKDLSLAILKQQKITQELALQKNYLSLLKELSSLRNLVDDFFDHIMVMVDDEAIRNNRLAILFQLKNLFLQVADISLL